MKEKYDVVIIGSGLGGLVSANILSREGYKVCVLEKNRQFGGNLQTFARDKNVFDTGIHYVGGLDKGQNLYRYFTYLGIMKDLNLYKLDSNFDEIVFGNSDKTFYHTQGYDNFTKALIAEFPEEEKAINTYCDKVKSVCNGFALYNIENGEGYDMDSLNLKVTTFLDSITDNQLLKAVLLGTNSLYAGEENTPFYVHALSVNSYIESSYRFVNGGSQISKLLIHKIKEFGGEVYNYEEVVKFTFKEAHELKSAITNTGKEIEADIFISNVDPKRTIKILEGKGFRKSFIKRIEQIENITSSFCLYISFKPETFPYRNYNQYFKKDYTKLFGTQDYTQESWPEEYMLSMGVHKNQTKWAKNMIAMSYMNAEEVNKWKDTFNTMSKKSDRGEAYEQFKQEKTEVFLNEIEKKIPNFKESISSVYASTPLTYRDYIGNEDGTMYGYKKDANNTMKTFLSPKTKIKNLYFTGQSINMHGVLGVTISAVLTCSLIVGREKLMKSIHEELQKADE